MIAGIHKLDAPSYHADPAPTPSLSNSIANTLITQSPLHARHQHPRLNPNYVPEQDSRFDLGSAAHMMLLERRIDGIVIVEAKDWKKKAAQEARDEARAEGKYPILARHYEQVQLMVGAATAFIETTELAGLFTAGIPEQTVLWQEGSVWCRCRPDLVARLFANPVILDYKTTENAEPDAFIRQIPRMGYDVQAEFYVRGVKTITQIEPTFVFLVQEISAPYACSLVALSNAYRAIGQQKVERAIGLWQRCMERNEWPSYSTRIAYAEPPSWALLEMDEAMRENDKSEESQDD